MSDAAMDSEHQLNVGVLGLDRRGETLVQAMADKAIANSKDCREVIGNSFDVDTFEPNLKQKKRWDETFEKFVDIATSSLLTQNLPQI